MDAALRRHRDAPTVRVFRAARRELGHADAFDDLSAMLQEHPASHVPQWLWQVAGEVFQRGQRWADAVVAFRRGRIDAPKFSDAHWLNQYALSLARSGASDAGGACSSARCSWPPRKRSSGTTSMCYVVDSTRP